MSPRQVDYVIFDVDGLLINSEHAYTAVIGNILAKHGTEFTQEMKSHIMGRPAREAFADLLSICPGIPLTVDTFLTQYDTALTLLWPTVTPLPGAYRLVRHLHAHGVPMALATSSRRKNYVAKTRHLRDMFVNFGDRVVCGDDLHSGMRGKPAPDIFLVAARELLGIAVGDTHGPCTEREREARRRGLVFEDGIAGMQGAKRAGMSVVWVPDGDLAVAECSGALKPDLILKSLEEFVPEEWGLQPYSDNSTVGDL